VDPPPAFDRRTDAVDVQRFADEVFDPVSRVERGIRVLEDDLDVPRQCATFTCGQSGDVFAFEQDRSAGGFD